MTAGSAEKVDPGHWTAIAAGSVMFCVVGLSSFAAAAPWWAEESNTGGQKSKTEVTLWIRYTRIEVEQDKMDCQAQCDVTKMGSAKVREMHATWGEVCREATDEMATNCTKLWVVRVGALLAWFCALIFCASVFLGFCGAGQPSSIRCPATCSLSLTIGCVLNIVMALSVAAVMDIRLAPSPPGTAPKPAGYNPSVPKVPLRGIGFWCILASFLCSLLGVAISWVQQQVMNHLELKIDVERGKPLADVNRADLPSRAPDSYTAPPPKALGAWT